MPATIDNVRFVLYDLKYSWWFRFWALFWLAGFVVSVVALGFLGKRADIAGKENDFHVWYENATSLNFPRFHFRIAGDAPGHTFLGQACYHAGLGLHAVPCQSWDNRVPPQGDCFAIPSDTINVVNHHSYRELREVVIECWINTTVPGNVEDLLIAWEMEGDNHASGGASLASVWIAPTESAWVLISNEKIEWNGREVNDWRRKLVYHSSERLPGQYRIATIIENFFVPHIEAADSFTGWMALGDAGGFAFFMIILHGVVMVAFGFCFTNNSKFLGGDAN